MLRLEEEEEKEEEEVTVYSNKLRFLDTLSEKVPSPCCEL
jgi:hypothetical protein